jgi:uncharacterized caspase-like protein
MFRTMLSLSFLVAVGLGTALAEGRVALVVGNGDYEHVSDLVSPKNDAADMTELLKSLGFEVSGGIDLDRKTMLAALTGFGGQAQAADVALFFYAGHGLQLNGQNYLVPIDAAVGDPAEIDTSLVSLSDVASELERGSKINIIFLDASRNNPFADALANAAGDPATSPADAFGSSKAQFFVAFSTQPGGVAPEGTGRNSPFTSALLKHLAEHGRSISDVMASVRKEVMAETAGEQMPWSFSTLADDFSFTPAGKQ